MAGGRRQNAASANPTIIANRRFFIRFEAYTCNKARMKFLWRIMWGRRAHILHCLRYQPTHLRTCVCCQVALCPSSKCNRIYLPVMLFTATTTCLSFLCFSFPKNHLFQAVVAFVVFVVLSVRRFSMFVSKTSKIVCARNQISGSGSVSYRWRKMCLKFELRARRYNKLTRDYYRREQKLYIYCIFSRFSL